MMRLSTGAYLLSLACLALGLVGILGYVNFSPVAGVLLYLLLREISDFIATIYFDDDM